MFIDLYIHTFKNMQMLLKHESYQSIFCLILPARDYDPSLLKNITNANRRPNLESFLEIYKFSTFTCISLNLHKSFTSNVSEKLLTHTISDNCSSFFRLGYIPFPFFTSYSLRLHLGSFLLLFLHRSSLSVFVTI